MSSGMMPQWVKAIFAIGLLFLSSSIALNTYMFIKSHLIINLSVAIFNLLILFYGITIWRKHA